MHVPALVLFIVILHMNVEYKDFSDLSSVDKHYVYPLLPWHAVLFVSTGAMGLQGDKMKDDKHTTNAGMVGGVFVPLVV